MPSFLPRSVGWSLAFGCFLSLLATQIDFTEAPASSRVPWLEDFNALAEEIIQYHRPPGVAIAIVTPSEVLALKTHGVRQLGQEGTIDENTIFRVASVSKPCTSALVAQLAAEGHLDIEAPLAHYLPDIQILGPAHTQNLKIQHLLSHTTGLPGYSLEQEAYRRQDFESLVKKLKSVRAVSTPGKVHQYQNVLYSLLGPVIESVTQASFADYLKKSLFQPLGITDYALHEADYAACENLAKPHLRTRRRTASKGPLHKVHQSMSYYDNILPAGGMGFSIKSMATLLQAFMGGHPAVLEDKMLKQCHAPVALVCKGVRGCKKQQCDCKKYITEHYGLGWRIQNLKGKAILYHRGEVNGYTASIAFSKEEQLGIVVLINEGKSRVLHQLNYCFFKMLFDEYHRWPERFKAFGLSEQF